MLYIIGLGLSERGISLEAIQSLKKCEKVYLENYTIDFPYSQEQLGEILGRKLIPIDRNFVEKLKILAKAKKENVALLVYGSPLVATTHITLLQEAEKINIKTRVIHSASVFDGVAETGLQLYKFGKIASIPAWKEKYKYKPASFMKTVVENQSINAHSLILTDIGLKFKDAINQLKIAVKETNLKLDKIIVCSRLGTKDSKIVYDKVDKIIEDINPPFCIIIPGKLHFVEEEFLSKL